MVTTFGPWRKHPSISTCVAALAVVGFAIRKAEYALSRSLISGLPNHQKSRAFFQSGYRRCCYCRSDAYVDRRPARDASIDRTRRRRGVAGYSLENRKHQRARPGEVATASPVDRIMESATGSGGPALVKKLSETSRRARHGRAYDRGACERYYVDGRTGKGTRRTRCRCNLKREADRPFREMPWRAGCRLAALQAATFLASPSIQSRHLSILRRLKQERLHKTWWPASLVSSLLLLSILTFYQGFKSFG